MSKIIFADVLRGLAAAGVLIWHICGTFWFMPELLPEFIHAPAIGRDVQMPMVARWMAAAYPFNIGSVSVALFFLISGFVIPISLQRYGSRRFLIARAFRIFPVYWASLALSVTSIVAVSTWFGQPYVFDPAYVAIRAVIGLRLLLGLPSIDVVVWTLEIELAFYLFAATCLGGTPSFRRMLAAGVVIAALAVGVSHAVATPALFNPFNLHVAQLASHFAVLLGFMLIGVAFKMHHGGRLSTREACAAVALLGLLHYVALRYSVQGANVEMVVRHTLMNVVAVMLFAACYTWRDRFTSNKLTTFLSEISYPLYVVHGVTGFAVMRVMLDLGAGPWSTIAGGLSVSVALAWCLHVVVERPSQAVGSNIARGASPLYPERVVG
jgi:peptidoglycan/LPS O-acetylase OafA/YrhL